MPENITPDARFKARVDLWMHSNSLMWSRLQPLYFIQIAYFAVSAYILEHKLSIHLESAAFALSLIFQSLLLSLAVNEKNDREMQAKILVTEFGFDPTEYSEKGQSQKYGLTGKAHEIFWWLRFGSFLSIYLLWMLIDLAVYAYVLFTLT
jgi:hypothetical protein